MLDLSFQVETAEPIAFSAAPALAFKLRIAATAADDPSPRIQTILLRCQIRIEPAQRRYSEEEQSGLVDLFGTPDRWNQTLKSFLWTNTSIVVPPFDGTTVVDLPVPCSFDFTVAVTKYFYSLAEGDVALLLLFSGTLFYEGSDGQLQVAQIPWEKEASFRLPVAVWRALIDQHYPNCAWLSLRRDVFDQLYDYKSRNGLPTWEETLDRLLVAAER